MSRSYFETIIARKFAGLAIRFQHIEGLYIAEVLGEGIRITGRPNSRRVTETGAAGIAPCLQSNSAREENEYVGPGIGNPNRGLAAETVGR